MSGRGARERRPSELCWAEVAPERWPRHDDDELRGALAGVLGGRSVAAIDEVLIARCGAWAAGWRWVVDEGSPGGGVVRAWCCSHHSFDGGDAAVATRVLAALAEWRRWLEHLQGLFAALRPRHAVDGLAHACTVLLDEVAGATGCGDAWYVHARQVMAWALESWGAAPAQASAAVASATAGVFESWVEVADPASLGAVVAAQAQALVPSPDAPDDLARWRLLRAALPLRPPSTSPSSGRGDGHARYIETVDAARDPGRAERLRAGLQLARRHAAAGALVDLGLLRELHAALVPAEGPEAGGLRRGTAWAKGGRERYGLSPDLARACDDALIEANDPDVDVVDRAARAYLDVCFFHPFVDGNARAARLVFELVLAREGVRLEDVEALFRSPVVVTAEAAEAFLRLARTLARRA